MKRFAAIFSAFFAAMFVYLQLEVSSLNAQLKSYHQQAQATITSNQAPNVLKMLGTTVRVTMPDQAFGSGVNIASIKYGNKYKTFIISCAHVCRGFYSARIERFNYLNGRDLGVTDIKFAEVIFSDPMYDIAVLMCDDTEPVECAEFVKPDEYANMKLFDLVYAVGCPLGFTPLISTGTISSFDYHHHLVISAPIMYGNSGGPLFNKNGKFIGIVKGFKMASQSMPWDHGGIAATPRWIATIVKRNGLGFTLKLNDGTSLEKFIDKRVEEALKKFEADQTEEKQHKEKEDQEREFKEDLHKRVEKFMKDLKIEDPK